MKIHFELPKGFDSVGDRWVDWGGVIPEVDVSDCSVVIVVDATSFDAEGDVGWGDDSDCSVVIVVDAHVFSTNLQLKQEVVVTWLVLVR